MVASSPDDGEEDFGKVADPEWLSVTQDKRDNSMSEGLTVPYGKYQADLQLSPTPDPAQWYTMLSNCDDVIDIDFALTLLNPGGWWYQHFSVDEQVDLMKVPLAAARGHGAAAFTPPTDSALRFRPHGCVACCCTPRLQALHQTLTLPTCHMHSLPPSCMHLDCMRCACAHEQGLLGMFVGWTVVYSCIVVLFVFMQIQSYGGYVHPFMALLSGALLMEYMGIMCQTW